MQFVSFVYRTKRTRSLLSPLSSSLIPISSLFVSFRIDGKALCSSHMIFLGGHCSIVGLVEDGLQ